MFWAIDLLASQYGWSKKSILEDTYLDELFYLQKKIQQRQVREHKMQLAIAQNSHVKDPKTLWKMLDDQDRELGGLRDEKLDKEGFARLKEQLSTSKAIKVK